VPEAFEIRPSPGAFFRTVGLNARLGWRFIVGVGFLAVSAAAASIAFGRGRNGGIITLLIGMALGVALACAALGLGIYFATTRLWVDGDRVGIRRLLSRQEWQLSDLARIVRRSVSYGSGLAPNKTYLIIDRRGRIAASLLAAYWNDNRVEELWRKTGLPIDGSWDDTVPYQ
jgi:hypothetical protein